MNDDLISRKALKKAFRSWKSMDDYYHDTDCVDIPLSEVFDIIDNAPTIEELPNGKKGKWARQSDDYHDYYECEYCGIAVGLDDIRNFCPNCGADMRGNEI